MQSSTACPDGRAEAPVRAPALAHDFLRVRRIPHRDAHFGRVAVTTTAALGWGSSRSAGREHHGRMLPLHLHRLGIPLPKPKILLASAMTYQPST